MSRKIVVKSLSATLDKQIADAKQLYQTKRNHDVKLGEMFKELAFYVEQARKSDNQQFVKNQAVGMAETLFASIQTRINKAESTGFNTSVVRATLKYNANPAKVAKMIASRNASLAVYAGVMSKAE